MDRQRTCPAEEKISRGLQIPPSLSFSRFNRFLQKDKIPMLTPLTRAALFLFGLVFLCTAAPYATAADIVENAADTPKPLNPEQSATRFQLPENLRIELVASEPLVT
ncbi:MAG: hypothetical protein OSA43_08440, partial [Pirellulales bacterium]|nr:hypothetical protein [Pirellulales bacterium]